MALADMYKVNNATYYESGHGMSGVFTDTIENLTANGMIDYSIFLNTGSTWTMKNTGTIGNHFAWYADWVGGVLAVRKGPDVIPITYLGSAILSKNTSCVVANLSAKKADGAGWANFKTARFMIDAIQFTQGSASQYVSFNYPAYSGTKYGFNSCFVESTAGYATSNTAHNYTAINDYTTLTGDNAKRIVYSNYQVMLTKYNPYLADNDNIDKYNIGYIWDFFDIGGEIVCVRDILRMPNSAHWQSWAYYHDVTDKYVTIGGFGGNIVAGTQGALPESDNVKGIFSYNNSGTSANWFTTKNAVDYKTNSLGLRWCVGNNTISTAKQWRDNVRLGVMKSDGVIKHNEWIIGESAIQASDNPNKNTDYDHIPAHGGGGGGSTGDDMEAMATGATGSSGGFTHFYVMSPQDLIDFLADFYTRASSGETLTNNLVCSYILGIPSSEFCATEEVEIAIHNSAQGTPFVSQAKYSHITATNNLLVVGSFDVPRMTNTFYDFAPYSTYEVFIPCCGWVALPDTVAGRRINVEMYIDVASCCLKAAVKTNDLGVCAVTNGVLGASIPIAVIESGILRGNNIQAGLGIIGGGINTGVGAGSGNAMGIGFGVQQILNGLVECTIAGNTNYTQQKGGTGDITQFAMGHTCYMKVSHPDIDPVVNDSIFGHSVGYLCNSIGKLSAYSGFTVCGNPHVTFSASAEEREEIERLLSMGVIL